MSHRYYLDSEFDIGAQVTLSGTEAHHVLNVMRAKAGQPICLFDGRGLQAEGQIVATSRRDVQILIQSLDSSDPEPKPRVVMAAAVPKGDRLRFMVEKLTELGAMAWLPLESDHSVNPLNPGTQKKVQQWIVDACKQSHRNHLLELLPAANLPLVVDQSGRAQERFIAVAPSDRNTSDRNTSNVRADQATKAPANDGPADANEPSLFPACDQLILIGPEGGFTSEEVQYAREKGFADLSIGTRVLRIETAALAALTLAMVVPQESS